MAVNKVKKILVVAYKARFGKMELEMLRFERFLMDFDNRYGSSRPSMAYIRVDMPCIGGI